MATILNRIRHDYALVDELKFELADNPGAWNDEDFLGKVDEIFKSTLVTLQEIVQEIHAPTCPQRSCDCVTRYTDYLSFSGFQLIFKIALNQTFLQYSTTTKIITHQGTFESKNYEWIHPNPTFVSDRWHRYVAQFEALKRSPGGQRLAQFWERPIDLQKVSFWGKQTLLYC